MWHTLQLQQDVATVDVQDATSSIFLDLSSNLLLRNTLYSITVTNSALIALLQH